MIPTDQSEPKTFNCILIFLDPRIREDDTIEVLGLLDFGQVTIDDNRFHGNDLRTVIRHIG